MRSDFDGVFFRQVLSWTEHCVPWPETWEHLDQCRWWPGRCKSWELVPKTAKPGFFQSLFEISHENTRWWAMWFIESMLHPLNQCLTHHANLNLLTTIYLRLREAHRLWLCQSHRVGVAQRSNRNQGLRFRCRLWFIHRPSWFLSFEFKPSDITTLCELIHRFFPPSTGGRNAATAFRIRHHYKWLNRGIARTPCVGLRSTLLRKSCWTRGLTSQRAWGLGEMDEFTKCWNFHSPFVCMKGWGWLVQPKLRLAGSKKRKTSPKESLAYNPRIVSVGKSWFPLRHGKPVDWWTLGHCWRNWVAGNLIRFSDLSIFFMVVLNVALRNRFFFKIPGKKWRFSISARLFFWGGPCETPWATRHSRVWDDRWLSTFRRWGSAMDSARVSRKLSM